ncbi:MAG: class I SAM-dependent methyltransferase [Patescibacteria group bacterium]
MPIQNKKLLDLGCGNGDNSFYYSRRGWQVTGVDIDVSVAKARYPKLNFLTMAAERLDFPDHSFDEVQSRDVLEHVDDLPLAIEEIYRVLKIGGRLVVSVPTAKSEKILQRLDYQNWLRTGHQRIFEAGELKKILENRGLAVVAVKKKGFFLFLMLWLMFKKKEMINSQRGDFAPSRFYYLLQVINQFFDANLTFQTRAKFIPVWLVTLPVGYLLDQIFPKTISLTAIKKF